jgi:hypothetical protein
MYGPESNQLAKTADPKTHAITYATNMQKETAVKPATRNKGTSTPAAIPTRT